MATRQSHAGRPALVNLIPYNPVPSFPYRTPSPSATARFAALLTQAGINVAIRDRKGDRIRAACGNTAAEGCQRAITAYKTAGYDRNDHFAEIGKMGPPAQSRWHRSAAPRLQKLSHVTKD